jgi:hypothetical protein
MEEERRTGNDPGHVGPKIDPGWLDVFRQVVMFLLGCWLIIFAATSSGHDIPFLATGLILFGMVPFEKFLMLRRNHRDREEREDEA